MLLCHCWATAVWAQDNLPIDPERITIARDTWGVAHIFAPTDAEVAYGLAWAHAEDNFELVQYPMLIAKGKLGRYLGKNGATIDAVAYLLDVRSLVEARYETTFSPAFKKILQAYAAGLNRYAALHPKEVHLKGVFPITPKDIVTAYTVSTALISNVHIDIARMFENTLGALPSPGQLTLSEGSNGIAIASHRTDEGKAFLLSNSHQPLRSHLSWYEVHVQSEEGWNFLGATFCGGVTPFVGTNPHLGWTHCVNYNNYHDVYQLEMHPDKGDLRYRYDGAWLPLEERIWKGKVKILGFLTIGVRRKFYKSKHGPVVKNKSGYYALRAPGLMRVGASEQWYHMNKATDLKSFKAAMELQEHPSLSTIYADQAGNIYFLDNGLFPQRDPGYHWDGILPGDTSAVVWAPEFAPLDSLLFVENPPSGYVYHMNNSGFNCTGPDDQPSPSNFPPQMGYVIGDGARHLQFQDLMAQYDTLSYADFKTIKYNNHLKLPLYTRTIQNWDLLRQLSPAEHPDLADIIAEFKKWEGSGAADNRQAAIFALASQYIIDRMRSDGIWDLSGAIPFDYYPNAMRYAKKHLIKHFGRLDIPLGDLQKHVRGDKVYPIGGLPESISAMYTIPWKKGMKQSDLGDSYILFATYGKEGVERIETVHCYGTSNRPESPHYNDQVELYINQQTKSMTLDKATILQEAKKTYHPE